MDEVDVRELSLSAKRATRWLHRLSDDSARVYFTAHALEQMAARKLTTRDVINCLRGGRVVAGPVQEGSGSWKATVARPGDGDRTCVVAVLDNDGAKNFVVVVTAYPDEDELGRQR